MNTAKIKFLLGTGAMNTAKIKFLLGYDMKIIIWLGMILC